MVIEDKLSKEIIPLCFKIWYNKSKDEYIENRNSKVKFFNLIYDIVKNNILDKRF